MNNITYTNLRRIIFSVYVISAILFTFLLKYLGDQEFLKTKDYATSERLSSAKLLKSQNYLNALNKSINIIVLEKPNINNILDLNKKAFVFRGSIQKLSEVYKIHISSEEPSIPELKENALLLHSVTLSMCMDMSEYNITERDFLLYDGISKLNSTINTIRILIDKLLSDEINYIKKWQDKSDFFVTRIQNSIMIFFILTTIFSVVASLSFAKILKSSLMHLRNGTQALSKGNLKHRFHDIKNDELGQVMHDFNFMAKQLDKKTSELENNTKELIEAHKHKDRFLANMSHELRTPLNAIVGFSDIIAQRAKKLKPEKLESYATRIISASEHLLTLISNLLDVAKIDAGVIELKIAKVNLVQTINNVVTMLKPLAEKKDILLNFNVQENLFINADKAFLHQIFINIINNAIKFTEKGSISIKIFQTSTDKYKIDIIDTGIGISKKNQKRIFKDFHRVESGLTSNYEGTGLGLTLSKRLIELHNGTISVTSKIKEGTTFSIILPKK